MRPYLVLCVMVLLSVVAFGQQPVPPIHIPYHGAYYGAYWGPFVPLVTTPMISLQTYSPNPVGATNATTGLVAGATNSTLSQISGDTSSVYTVPVWYQGGGAPVIAPAVELEPQPLSREMHRFPSEHAMAEHGAREREKERANWNFIAGPEYTSSATAASGAAKTGKKAAHSYTNHDVERQNDNNGTVKYNGKSEKM